jgi:hypothetical protein
VEVNRAVAETAFVQQFELQVDIVGRGIEWLDLELVAENQVLKGDVTP